MGGIGVWQIVILAIVVLVLFGRGRISEMMGDFGKGIKSFKQGMNEGDEADSQDAPRIEGPSENAKSAPQGVQDPKPADTREPRN